MAAMVREAGLTPQLCAGTYGAERKLPIVHRAFHIVEEPGGIERMSDCECPTEEYYDLLTQDRWRRFPKADKSVHEHLDALDGPRTHTLRTPHK